MKTLAQLQAQITDLQQQLAQKDSQIAQQENQLEHRDQTIVVLREQLQYLLRRRFAASSEKVCADQLSLFDESDTVAENTEQSASEEPSETGDVQPNTQKRSSTRQSRVSIPDDYPREEVVYDIADEQKHCPHDGAVLRCIGSEDHEQLDIIPAKIRVLRHKRLKYACPCCESYLITANKPKQPIEKSIASPGLLACVATQKYVDALPLYRQSQMFERIGIKLDRSNLANWMVRCGELVQPLINLLTEHVHQQPVLHLDETRVQVLEEPGKTAQSQSQMWLMGCFSEQPALIYHYDPTRSQQVPVQLLTQDVPAIMVDGYEGYQSACESYQIKRLGCWAHARRYFVDAQKQQPKGKTGKADQALALIQKLYGLEKIAKDQPPDQRYQLRQQQAKPIIEKLRQWLEKSLPQVPPKTLLGKALHYLHNQWDRLVGYLEDGHYPIDNNAAERAIRPFTIGRKNWLFSKSTAGAKASANLYSLVQTAKANGLNPERYLYHVFKDLPNALSLQDIEALLPWNIAITTSNN